MKFATSCIGLIASTVADLTTLSGVTSIQDAQDECRRELPSFALEWDDHGIEEWWLDVQAEYAASDAEFLALWNEWQAAKNDLVTRYVTQWSELIAREYEIDMRAMNDICHYVAHNVYVNGIRLGNVIPELASYMQENYDSSADNIVNMFGLHTLNL